MNFNRGLRYHRESRVITSGTARLIASRSDERHSDTNRLDDTRVASKRRRRIGVRLRVRIQNEQQRQFESYEYRLASTVHRPPGSHCLHFYRLSLCLVLYFLLYAFSPDVAMSILVFWLLLPLQSNWCRPPFSTIRSCCVRPELRR